MGSAGTSSRIPSLRNATDPAAPDVMTNACRSRMASSAGSDPNILASFSLATTISISPNNAGSIGRAGAKFEQHATTICPHAPDQRFGFAGRHLHLGD